MLRETPKRPGKHGAEIYLPEFQEKVFTGVVKTHHVQVPLIGLVFRGGGGWIQKNKGNLVVLD